VSLKHTDPSAAEALTTAWQSILGATLSIWTGSSSLEVAAVATFARSMLHALPSSSHDTSPSASNAQALSELLVDAIWALDTQIDDLLMDAKATLATGDASEGAKEAEVAVMQKAKAKLEKDKETLADLVKRLSVSYYIHGLTLDATSSQLVSLLCGRLFALPDGHHIVTCAFLPRELSNSPCHQLLLNQVLILSNSEAGFLTRELLASVSTLLSLLLRVLLQINLPLTVARFARALLYCKFTYVGLFPVIDRRLVTSRISSTCSASSLRAFRSSSPNSQVRCLMPIQPRPEDHKSPRPPCWNALALCGSTS